MNATIPAAQAALPSASGPPLISFVIKTLNEEAKIARCIESVLVAAGELPQPWEIIVADSVSDDRTVEIAARYPVTIVQLARAAERGCGAGVQLGYQHARGALVFLLDGDMELCPGFLPTALVQLDREPRLAGVAGLLLDTQMRNAFDRYRVVNAVAGRARRERWLSGGGLYRREAIEQCGGYAADRNLKGWEEAELGMRLSAGGWALERIDVPAVLHTGHGTGTWPVLASLWRTGRAMSGGVLIRQAAGKPWFRSALLLLLLPLLVVLMWIGLAAGAAWLAMTGTWHGLAAWVGLVLVSMGCFAIHKRSWRHAWSSFGLWHFSAAALLVGLFQRTVPPGETIASSVLVSRRSP